MPEAKKLDSMKVLADALDTFCKNNPGGHPDYDLQIQKATMAYKAALEKVEQDSQYWNYGHRCGSSSLRLHQPPL